MKKQIKSDLFRYYGNSSGKTFIRGIFFNPGFRITFLYRVAKFYKRKNKLLFIFFRLLHRHYSYKFGIDLAIDATIGYGLYIGHFGGITISPDTIMGDNCNLSQGVTIGVSGRGENRGVPKLGNCIFVGPGAKLFGKIEIGDFSAIGANAVVNKSFKSQSVIVGIPSKSISQLGSDDFILNKYIDES